MSEVVSTSKEKDLKPYWNESCKDIESHLWLPTETALSDLGLTYSSSCLSTTTEKSWFSTKMWKLVKNENLLKTYSLSYTTSHVECTDVEVIKVKKIRLYPTAQQRVILKQWLGTSRFVYNKAIEHLNLPKEERCGHWMGAKKLLLNQLDDWAKATPYQIKGMAVSDAYQAFYTNVKKKKPFNLKFRSRKEPKQSCFIPASAISNGAIYARKLNKIRMTENLPINPKDSRLVLENNRWFLSVPYSVVISTPDNQGRIVALDPGIRTFMTGFSDTLAFKIGSGDFTRIARLAYHLDKLLSKQAKAKSKQKKRLGNAAKQIRVKIRNLVDELHNKTVKYLTDNFDVILLPTFETSNMVAKLGRKLHKKSVRNMLTFAFYRFGQKLETKAKSLGKLVMRVSEAYTSKTASWSGEIVNIGSSKIIKSNGLTMDRDLNGARGILLRALVDSPLALNKSYAFVAN